MNKRYETAIKHRETTAASKTFSRLDYHVGDIIQLRADGKEAAGKIGAIIGIRVIERDGGQLAYTIKLSDKKSVEVCAGRMTLVREADI